MIVEVPDGVTTVCGGEGDGVTVKLALPQPDAQNTEHKRIPTKALQYAKRLARRTRSNIERFLATFICRRAVGQAQVAQRTRRRINGIDFRASNLQLVLALAQSNVKVQAFGIGEQLRGRTASVRLNTVLRDEHRTEPRRVNGQRDDGA